MKSHESRDFLGTHQGMGVATAVSVLVPRLTYHDDSSRLFRRTHAHNWCHADRGPLEINSARK